MFDVYEESIENQLRYRIESTPGDAPVSTSIVHIRAAETTAEGRPFWVFYDSAMNLLQEPSAFVSLDGMRRDSQNYKLMAVTALKLLFSYLEIHKKRFSDITGKDVDDFLYFLSGISRKGLIFNYILQTRRSNSTVAAYIKVFRRFARYLGYSNHILLQRTSTPSIFTADQASTEFTSMVTYDVNVKTPKNDIVPAYITLTDYQRILTVIDDPTARILCRLMYECGLRIGECLGLTLEDVVLVKSGKEQGIYAIELRNRLSDDKSGKQAAKGVIKVRSRNDYTSSEYKKSGIGYQRVVLTASLSEELLEYINNNHNISNHAHYDNYKKFAVADRVKSFSSDGNYYIFLNHLLKPLTQDLWNRRLRIIFQKAEIPIDSGSRKNNLNHRFRHGFAMQLSKIGVSDLDIMALMRHRSITSTAVYHKLTEEDIAQVQSKLLNELYAKINKIT